MWPIRSEPTKVETEFRFSCNRLVLLPSSGRLATSHEQTLQQKGSCKAVAPQTDLG